MTRASWKVIDLFSGAGGMSLGFDRAGFATLVASDSDDACIRTFNANFDGDGVVADVDDLVASGKLPKADVVIGGPPCQGFSLLNKRRIGDERRALWRPFMDAVEQTSASAFVIENVVGLLSSEEATRIRERARSLGFETAAHVLTAADYGTPQTRRRAFIFGWKPISQRRFDFPPLPTHARQNGSESNLSPWVTVRQAIGDLPPPEGTEIRDLRPPLDLHFGRNPTAKSLARYRAVPPGGNRFDLQRNAPEITPDCWVRKTSGGTDLFGRLWWDRPSVTIRTEFFKPEKGRYLHPTQDRPITHREAARLMGFPDYFKFHGTKIEIARQIGNAVPPLLAEAVAGTVRAYLESASLLKVAA